MANVRYGRMNEELKRVISEIVQEMNDPRISDMTSIMSVEVTPDLMWATARVSVYDKDDELRKQTVAALNHASGFIAREVGKRMQIRRLPQIKFTLDSSIEYSVHISKIIGEINRTESNGEQKRDD